MKELTYRKTFLNKGSLSNIFIPTNKKWVSTESDNRSIIESGEKGVLFNKIINDIENAKEMICLQSFLIQDTKIIDALVKAKQDRNVRVFVLDSAEARLNNSGFEEDESFATKDYKKMLEEKFKNNFVHRQANNLHAKFILIDPKTNHKGYIFTGNFNQKPFFENPELSVQLSKLQTEELFKVFVYHFWEHTTDEQTETNQFDKVKPLGQFNAPSLNNILITSPNIELSNLQNTLIEAVSNSTKEITFSTFGFDLNHKLSKTLLNKLKSGVSVKIFCRLREKAIVGNIEVLAQNGAIVICHPLIHAKTLLIDNTDAYIFTANFEKHGMDTGFEVGIKLNRTQVEDLKLVLNNWNANFPYRYEYKKAISEIHNYIDFSDTRKQKIIIPEKNDTDSKSISTVSELIKLIENIKEPTSFKEKKYVIEYTMKLENINDYQISRNIFNGVDLIEYENKSKKKTEKKQGLLFEVNKVHITPEVINDLKTNYNNYQIFVK